MKHDAYQKLLCLLLAAVLLFGSGALVLERGYTFMPEMEMTQMMVTLTMPEDSSFADTCAMADAATERMLSVDGVETVGGSVGDSTGMAFSAFTGAGDVTYYVLLREGGPRASEVAKAINELKGGRVEYRADRYGICHVPLGKVSFPVEKLAENYGTLFTELLRVKPSSAKGRYVKSVVVSSSMGPGVHLDPMITRDFLA